VVLVVVFAAWYTLGAVGVRRRHDAWMRWAWLVVLAAVWAALSALAPEFIWVAFPLWLLAGHLLGLRPAAVFSTLVLAVVIVVPIVDSGTVDSAFVIGPVVGGLFAFGISRGYLRLIADARERQRLVASLIEAHDDLARLQEELGEAQRASGAVAERARLSRDIHDTIAQALSAILLLARSEPAAGEDDAVSGGDARAALASIETIAADSLVDVRRIVHALDPAQLEEGSLAASLRRMLDRLAAETGIATELDADSTLPVLPVGVEIALLRTAQSALSNVRLHAGASRVVVHLTDAGDTVRLDVVDDGRGFDTARWAAEVDRGVAGYGLRSMRDRLRELGGGLEVESGAGPGAGPGARDGAGPREGAGPRGGTDARAGTALSAHLPIALAASGEEEP